MVKDCLIYPFFLIKNLITFWILILLIVIKFYLFNLFFVLSKECDENFI